MPTQLKRQGLFRWRRIATELNKQKSCDASAADDGITLSDYEMCCNDYRGSPEMSQLLTQSGIR